MPSLPPPSQVSRLLVVKTSSLGDVIHALPVVQALKEARPGLTLGWVVRRRCADILRGNPVIDHLYIVPDKPSLRDLSRLKSELRAARYQVTLDMQGLFLSGLLTRLSGAPVRVGWDRNREANALFLTHAVVPGRRRDVGVRHEVDLLYGFAEALGVRVAHPEFTPQTYLAADEDGQVGLWLANVPRPRIVVNIGAARAYKRWPVGNWRAVAEALIGRNYGLVFVGDKNDAASVAQITAHLPRGEHIVDLSGRTSLRQLGAVLAACDLVLSGDSGPMHLAVAVGTPVVALFGATDPARHGPYGARNTVLHRPPPGLMPTAKRPTPEQGAACMAALTPADVLAAVQNRCGAPQRSR